MKKIISAVLSVLTIFSMCAAFVNADTVIVPPSEIVDQQQELPKEPYTLTIKESDLYGARAFARRCALDNKSELLELLVVLPSPELYDYKPDVVQVSIKSSDMRRNFDFTPEDFPEIPVTDIKWFADPRGWCDHMDTYALRIQIVELTFDTEGGLTLEDAIEKISHNPHVKRVNGVGELKVAENTTYTYCPAGDHVDSFEEISDAALSANEIDITKGDVNLDGKINAKDISLIIKHLTGLTKLSDESFLNADANSDGKVNAKDVTKVLRIIVNAD